MNTDFNPPAELSTARLFLRKPRLEDAGPLFHAYARDRDIVRFMTWRAHATEDVTLDYLRHCRGEWSKGSCYAYIIEIGHEPAGPVGMISLRKRAHGVEFGYVIARPHWGQGYMTEALGTLVDWSLDQPRIWRASAFCDIDNLASARVMEKAGMTFEGILRRYLVHPNISDEPSDCRMYARVRS